MTMEKEKMRLSILLLMAVVSSVHMIPPATASRSSSSPSPAGPVCAASGTAPVVLGVGEALSFCGLSGASCCDATADAVLREQFVALNVSDNPGCAAILKDIICAKCVPSLSTEMFNAADPGTVARSIPLLCGASPSSSPPTTSSARRRSSASTTGEDPLCLERVHTAGSYIGMAPHPDGSSRVFLWTQDGKVSVAWVPRRDSGRALGVRATPILDLTGRVLEVLGVAFHREFATNGRFFVSYACDSSSPSSSCGGGGSGDGGGGAAAGNGSMPSQYLLVISEFSANVGARNFSKAADPVVSPPEVRRIFSMDLPLQHKSYSYQQHGGQILFPPTDGDGYLYLIAGHGGDGDHSSDKNNNMSSSFYGKIIRFDVDRAASKPEIVAIGLQNPRGCSFDSERSSDLYCAGIDEKENEQVYLISNLYGNDYTGSPATAISLVINHGRPAAGRRGTSIVGGRTYDGLTTNPFMKGRYMYSYRHDFWVAALVGENDCMLHSTRITNIMCSGRTPLPCHKNAGGMGSRNVLSFGEDNSKDAFFLSIGGIYRVVEPGLCTLPQPHHQSTDDAYSWLLHSKSAGGGGGGGQQQITNPEADEYSSWLGSGGIPVAVLSLFLLYVAYKKFLAPAPTHECNSCWGSNIFGSSIYVNHNYGLDGVVSWTTPPPRSGATVEMAARFRTIHQ